MSGTPASEVLKGNGTSAGYVLGHGNVVENSEFVYIGVRRAKRGVDYTLDYDSGSLYLTQAVRSVDSVRVDYRYVVGSKTERNVSTPAMIPLRFGDDKNTLSLAYAYRAGDISKGLGAVDILTYGLSANTSLGSLGKVESMFYTATPQQSTRLSLLGGGVGTKAAAPEAKKGNFNVQNATLRFGGGEVKLGYQDIDTEFSGFQSMRDSGAAPVDLLNALEKEKGLRRNSMSFSLPSGKSGGLSLTNSRIADDKGEITSTSYGYTGSRFGLSMSTREVAKEFTRFADLREGDRAQMANEAGMKRNLLNMQIATGSNSDKSPMWSSFQKTELSGETGKLTSQFTSLNFGALQVQMGSRSMDEGFNRMAALNDEDRTRMALDARRQFNPDAQAGEVTADDKTFLNNEAGINRDNRIISYSTKGLRTWMTNSSISDKNGGITRQATMIQGSTFSLLMNRQSVDQSFTRVGSLQAVERAKYGNEVGLKRSDDALSLVTGKGADKSLLWSSFKRSQISGQDGAMSLRSMDLNFGALKYTSDSRQVDVGFNRIGALNDDERTRAAWAARRQFDSNAQVGQVTNDDRGFLNNENGLSRKNESLQYNLKGVSAWMSQSSVETQDAGIHRTAYSLETKPMSLSYLNQSIDKGFNRIGSLQAVERTAFGNEYGISRTTLSGALRMKGSNLSFTDTNLSDETAGTMARRSIDFSSQRLKVRANFLDISSDFARVNDLVDADKGMLTQEIGFKRTDYSINFQALKDLNIDTYLYDSANATNNRDRMQRKFVVNYTPTKGPRITAFRDDYSDTASDGIVTAYHQERLTSESAMNVLGGLFLKTHKDSTTSQSGSAESVTNSLSTIHVETNPRFKTILSFDQSETRNGKAVFETTNTFGMKSAVSKTMSLYGAYGTTDRDSGRSEKNYAYGIEWAMRSDLKLTMGITERTGGPSGTQRSHQFGLSGTLAKKFLFLSDVTVNSSVNTRELRGAQTGCNNTLNIKGTAWGGWKVSFDEGDVLNEKESRYYTTRTFKLESDPNPNKWYHYTYEGQNFKMAGGNPGEREKQALDLRLNKSTNLIFSSYFGKDGEKGALLPIGGQSAKLSKILNARATVTVDYQIDTNEATSRRARTIGAGLSQKLSDKSSYDIYYGFTSLREGSTEKKQTVYRVKFDQSLSADQSISLSAIKRSDLEKSAINPAEGDTVVRVDLNSLFD